MFRACLLAGWLWAACGASGLPLRGVVVDAFDQRVAGAEVRCTWSYDVELRTTSGTDGSFEFELELPPSQWLRLGLLAYAPPRGTAVVQHEGPLEWLDQPLLLRLQPAATLSGTVVGPGAVPQAGAVVTLLGLPDWFPMVPFLSITPGPWESFETPLDQAVCNGTGRFAFPGLPRHQYVCLRITQPGMLPYEADNLDIEPDQRFVLDPGATVTGRVLQPGGQPAAGLDVRMAYAFRDWHASRTGPDGRYRFDGVPRGWSELASAADAKGRVISPQKLTIEDEAQTLHVPDVTLSPGVRLRGQVIDAGVERPLPRCPISLTAIVPSTEPWQSYSGTDWISAEELQTSADGTFTTVVARLPYFLSAGPRGYGGAGLYIDTEQSEPAPLRIVLAAVPRELHYPALEGVVEDESGEPIAGAQVSWDHLHITDAAGRFCAAAWSRQPSEDFPDDWLLRVEAPGYEDFELSSDDLTPEQPLRITMVRDGDGALSGEVVDLDGRPLPGALVLFDQVRNSDDRDPDTTYPEYGVHADGNGRFRFKTWTDVNSQSLVARLPGYRYVRTDSFDWQEPSRERARITMAWVGGEATGTVVDAAGRPVDAARVYAWGGVRSVVFETGLDGRFKLHDLPAGTVTIEAVAGRQAMGRATVEVGRDQSPEATLRLADQTLPVWGEPGPAEQARAEAWLREAWDLILMPVESDFVTTQSERPMDLATMVLRHAAAVQPKLAWSLALWETEPDRLSFYLLTIFDELAATDPAAGWAQRGRLVRIPQPAQRVMATARLGRALVKDHPDQAAALYELIRNVELDIEDPWSESVAYADRAVLAMKLGRPEAAAWLDQVLRPAYRDASGPYEQPTVSRGQDAWYRWNSVRRLAREPELAPRVLPWMEVAQFLGERGYWTETSPAEARELRYAKLVELVAEHDPLAALDLFNEGFGRTTPLLDDHGGGGGGEIVVLPLLVRQVAAIDPGRAGTLARRIVRRDDRVEALTTVAARLPDPSHALRLLRELRSQTRDASPLAHLALDISPTLANRLAAQAADRGYWHGPEESFNLARIEPNACRLVNERWLSVGDDGEEQWYDLTEPAMAMLALDPDRAVTAIDRDDDPATAAWMLCAAARWVMLSPADRRATGLRELEQLVGDYRDSW